MYLHIPAVNPHVRMIVRSISTLLLFYTLRSPTFPVRPAQEIGGLRDTPKSLNWWDFLCVYKSIYVLILCKYYTYIYIHIHPKVRNSMWSLKRSLGFSAVGLKFRPSNCGHIQQNLVVHRVTKPTYLSKGARLVWVCLKIMWTFPRCLRIMIWWPDITRNKGIIGHPQKGMRSFEQFST